IKIRTPVQGIYCHPHSLLGRDIFRIAKEKSAAVSQSQSGEIDKPIFLEDQGSETQDFNAFFIFFRDQQHLRGSKISVNDACVVRRLQGSSNLLGNRTGAGEGQWGLFPDHFFKGHAVQEFPMNEKVMVFSFLNCSSRSDVGVPESLDLFQFLLEGLNLSRSVQAKRFEDTGTS